MIYVFPHCAKKENEIKKIKGISRLFAYPKKPHFENEGELVILDSGAYGLSLSGKKMTESYMMNLNRHYLKYYNKRTLCIAPDEFLNPHQSMLNFEKWVKLGFYKDITAVLQCSKKYIVNKSELIEQLKFYSKYNVTTLCFSNNSLTGELAVNSELPDIVRFIKERTNIKWLHNLGAGWSLKDIEYWKQINFDSLDSVAYYSTKDKSEFGSLDCVKNIQEILKII